MKTNRINGLILAAGSSTRMGTFKPLLPFGRKTLLETAIDSMLDGGVSQIVLVLGYRGKELQELLEDRYPKERLVYAYNESYATTDMLCSIKIGLSHMPPCDAFFLLPGDMPLVAKETYRALVRARTKEPSILFPTLEGYRKHPPLIDHRFVEEILQFTGNGGLRELWKLHEENMVYLPVEDPGCAIDLDTPKQYEQCVSRFVSDSSRCENDPLGE